MDYRVQKAVKLIQKDFSRDLKTNEIADLLNISPSRLRHLFKDDTGTTLVQYLKTLRLRQAKYLLETTFLTVKEIMLQVGCKDESNFVRDFKKQYGLTPAKYREIYFKGTSLNVVATFTDE
jgi:AraC-like DNA-binding protein